MCVYIMTSVAEMRVDNGVKINYDNVSKKYTFTHTRTHTHIHINLYMYVYTYVCVFTNTGRQVMQINASR